MALKQNIKITETVTGRKTPGNITSFLENEYYYSQSKGVNIKIGEMDLFYYINSTNKEFRELDVNKDALNKLREVKNILGPIA